jgi:hypothetical protein
VGRNECQGMWHCGREAWTSAQRLPGDSLRIVFVRPGHVFAPLNPA